MLLDLSRAPREPIARILWLSGVAKQAAKELDAAFAAAYFDARIKHQLDAAVKAGPHARKKVLAFTRAENESRGRTVRWNDGADPTSTAYSSRT